jgi:hypothetical protein
MSLFFQRFHSENEETELNRPFGRKEKTARKRAILAYAKLLLAMPMRR